MTSAQHSGSAAVCASPLGWDTLVDYWAGDLPQTEIERIDEHLFGCAACSAESAQVARIAQAFRATTPPIISASEVQALRARGLSIHENPCQPGLRREVSFEHGVDILLHRLGGLELTHAQRVQVTVCIESSGQRLFDDYDAPFDRERGEVLIACQRHFASFPHDVVFEVRAFEASGAESMASFAVPHVFP